ncbi:nucleoside diphosphate kinase regulator [Vogesella facilis]|uniref:Nucleoside diphosphate kinase regulator n=1 Tax=Vogesella facilis TaxID=1655232 RepID=A0ABV7RIE7_9NEIS
MPTLPSIIVSSLDYERLSALLAGEAGHSEVGRALEDELDRADIVEPADMPADVVTMNSRVRFHLGNGNIRELTLVYPRDADGSADRISILAPVGCSLLGMAVGQSMDWPLPDGSHIVVTIDGISYQPEAAGEPHR